MSKVAELNNTQALSLIESSQKKGAKKSYVAQRLILDNKFVRSPKIKLIKSQKKELHKLTRRKRRLLEIVMWKRAKESLHQNYKTYQDDKSLLRFLPTNSYHLF